MSETPLTPEEINSAYKIAVANDPDRRDYYSEVARARFILLGNPTDNPVTILQRNLVPHNVITAVTGEQPTVAKRERRADKYKKLTDWCKDHHAEQVTVAQIAEIGDLSYPTALKFVNDRPDMFYKIKRGLYEARNPEIMRAAEKGASATK